MILLQGKELSDHIGSIIHKNTQQHNEHFDLTVKEIYELTEPGSLDFGGSEFHSATQKEVKPQKNEEDKYGWWHLPAGIYQAVMNEEIKKVDDTIVLLAPHFHAQKAGILMNTGILSNQEEKNISITFGVPEVGCNIKENARFAVLYLLAS